MPSGKGEKKRTLLIFVDIRLTGIVHKTVVDADSDSKGEKTGIMGWCFPPKREGGQCNKRAERESIPDRGGY